jgi:hypothetical protein
LTSIANSSPADPSIIIGRGIIALGSRAGNARTIHSTAAIS